jgi:membrane protein
MLREKPQTKWQKIQDKMRTRPLGRRLLLWIDTISRFVGLKVIPAIKRFVLPGCAGVPLLDILKNFGNRDMWQSAKALSYSLLTAIPPLLVFMFSSIAYFPVNGVQDQLLVQLQQFIPAGIFDRVADTINDIMGHRHGSLLSIGFITSVVLACNGMYGMMMSFNFIDKDDDERPVWLRYVVSLILVFLLYFLIVIVLTLLIGYQLLQKWLIAKNILAPSIASLFIFNVGRWAILVFVTLFIISIIYYIAPSRKRTIGFFSVGAVLSTLLFFGLAWAFQVYLRVFNNYNILYGSIGTLLVLMLWVYANCSVILIGYGINVAVAISRGDEGRVTKLSKKKKKNVHKPKPPYHRPVQRAFGEGQRQINGGPMWFGPAVSVRNSRASGANGKDVDK